MAMVMVVREMVGGLVAVSAAEVAMDAMLEDEVRAEVGMGEELSVQEG